MPSSGVKSAVGRAHLLGSRTACGRRRRPARTWTPHGHRFPRDPSCPRRGGAVLGEGLGDRYPAVSGPQCVAYEYQRDGPRSGRGVSNAGPVGGDGSMTVPLVALPWWCIGRWVAAVAFPSQSATRRPSQADEHTRHPGSATHARVRSTATRDLGPSITRLVSDWAPERPTATPWRRVPQRQHRVRRNRGTPRRILRLTPREG